MGNFFEEDIMKSESESLLECVIHTLLEAQQELEDVPEEDFAPQVVVDIHWAITDAMDLIEKAIKQKASI